MVVYSIITTALFSSLLMLAAHALTLLYWPKMDMVPRYVIGTLAMLVPPSVYLGLSGEFLALSVIWASVVMSGLTVIVAKKSRSKWEEFMDGRDALEREHAAQPKSN